jgi:FkbM family methyltransferase
MTAWCAGLVARFLSSTAPEQARGFGLWYRRQCVLHPRWVHPVPWEADVELPCGASMRVPFREAQGMSIILNKGWETSATRRVMGSVEAGSVVVDVGANLGYYTLIASRSVGPGGLVLAFEPSPRKLQYLLKNVEANGRRNVVVFSEALSDSCRLARLSTPLEFNRGVGPLSDGAAQDHTLTATRRLDDIVYPLGLQGRVGFVKIDADGSELGVLRGMKSVLASNDRIKVLCGLRPDWAPVPEILELMRGLEFRGEVLDGGRWRRVERGWLPERQCDAWFTRY